MGGNVKIIKEKNKSGEIESYTVIVNKGGCYLKQRFKNMDGAFQFIRELEQGDKQNLRRYNRIDSLNLIHYMCYDEESQIVSQGMGRTLNVSRGGVLLETHVPLEQGYIISMTVGIDDQTMELQGKVVHCKMRGERRFESGIEFLLANQEAIDILTRHIHAMKEKIISEKAEERES
jgi:hypothetical protein